MKIAFVLPLFSILFLTACAKNIVTAIPENDEWIVVSTFAGWGRWDIYGVNTKDPQNIVPDMAYVGANPDWSPDGQWVVYSTSYKASHETSEIYIVKNDGTHSVRLAKGDKPVWSPTGNQIAYTFRNEIHLLDANCLIDGRSCDPEPSIMTTGQNPDWSSDGRRVVFELREAIYVMNSDGTEMDEVSIAQNGGCREPDWSPTSEKILFWCWGDNEGLYIVNSDGTDVTKFEIGDMGGVSPKWSPSGDKIAFIQYLSINSVEGAHSAVYVMNADGSNITRLTFGESERIFGFSWMPPHMKPETCTAFCQ